jgi:hypothetical protein
MRIERRFLGWGVFFIVAGGIALAVRGGYLSPDQASQVWRLWPLLLVGLGVAIILGRTSVGWLGGLIIAATFGLLVGSALVGGVGQIGCGLDLDDRSAAGGAEASVGGDLGEGASVEVTREGCSLHLTTAPGTAWSLTYPSDSAPRVEESEGGLRLSPSEGSFFGAKSDWRLTLPSDRTLALEVEANAGTSEILLTNARLSHFSGTFNAGSFRVDLTGATLGGLDMRANAGSGSLTLPAGTFNGRVDVNAGSLDVCAPEGTGLRITTNGTLASTDFASSGLVLTGSTWESPGYASAPTKIDLTLNANAASLTLRRDGGCS